MTEDKAMKAKNGTKVRLSDAVVEKLEAMVTAMSTGERLPTEKELAEQFSVGRSTIRESLKTLSSRNMIVRRNGGTFVADPVTDCLVEPLGRIIDMGVGSIGSLMELREILEMNTIRMAAERATEEDVNHIKRVLWLMDEPDLSNEESRKRDIQFHNAIADSTGNAIIVELLKALRTVLAQHVEDGRKPVSFKYQRDFHNEMVDAVSAHDPDAAQRCMEEYFIAVHERMGI